MQQKTKHIIKICSMILFYSAICIAAFLYLREQNKKNAKFANKVFDQKAAFFQKWSNEALTQNQNGFWFGDLKSLDVSDDNLMTIAQNFSENILKKQNAVDLTRHEILKTHHQPTLVFATVVAAQKKKFFFASGNGLLVALQNLQNQLQNENIEHLKIDFVKTVRKNPKKSLSANHVGIWGQALDNPQLTVIFPEEILANPKMKIPPEKTGGTIYEFTTKSFYASASEFFPLYRGHRMIDTLTQPLLDDVILKATNYLSNHINKNGKFDYIVYPYNKKVSSQYNIVRHAGTLYALIESYEYKPDEKLLKKIESAITFLIKQSKACGKNDEGLCFVENKTNKLGANALALLALSKYTQVTQDRKYWDIMQKIALSIVAMQKDNGEFISEVRVDSWEATDFVSEYYPGESILALVRLYRLEQNPVWIETATKACDYLTLVRDKDVKKINHDHWLLMGLNELQNFVTKPHYIEYAKKIVLAIQEAQIKKSSFADYIGGYFNPPNSTPAAVRTEGLVAAYHLFQRIGDKELANTILPTIEKSLKFQLQTRIENENSIYFKKSFTSIGGFQESPIDNKIRIDYVQHNLSGILGYQKLNLWP